jgi:hypothetical protein
MFDSLLKHFLQNEFFKRHTVTQIDFFLLILKVANIRCFILIKCSEQEAYKY